MMKSLWLAFPLSQFGRLPIFFQMAGKRYTLSLLAFFIFSFCPGLAFAVPGGDLAPRGVPNGQLDVGDLVILEQFVLGTFSPTADEFKIADVAPLGHPDGKLDAADIVLLQRAIFGEVTLPEVQLGPITLPASNLDTSKPMAAATYLVTGNITLPTGQTLTIQPGAIFKFQGNYSFTVNGTLIVGNATGAPVTFTSDKTQPAVGDWGGIVINNSATGTTITNAVIQYATTGVTVNTATATLSKLNISKSTTGISLSNVTGGTIKDSQISDCPNGISLLNSTGVTIDNNTLNANTTTVSNGISLATSAATITHNTINNLTNGVTKSGIGIYAYSSSTPTITAGNTIKNAAYGIYLVQSNGTISGNAILDNSTYGIDLWAASPTISDNTIQNDGIGIFICEYSNPIVNGNNIITANNHGICAKTSSYDPTSNPVPIINHNQIYGNTTYDLYTYSFYNAANVTLNAEYNWWGTTNTSAINAKIYDHSDEPNYSPVVDYANFLDSPQGEPISSVNYLSGTLSTATPLATGNYYEPTGDVTVAAGTTLIIQPGARLGFAGNYNFVVEGTLLVQGTEAAPAKFFSPTQQAGAWPGITIRGAGSVIDHAQMQYADNGITVDGVNATITNSKIIHNNHGIHMIHGAGGTVSGNEITANGHGLYLLGNNFSGNNPMPSVNSNKLYGNTTYDFSARSYFDPKHTVVNATGNWWGTTGLGEIGTKVYDYSDDLGASVVNFAPILNGPGGSPITSIHYLNGVLDTASPLTAGVYDVVGNIYVEAGRTLTIQAGVTLNFHNNYSLTVDGALLVQGDAGHPVNCTSPGQPEGPWHGIILNGPGSVIDHAIIEHADNGITVAGTNATITNSVLRNNNHGIHMINSASGTVSGNQVTANDIGVFLIGDGLAGHNPLPVVTGNDLAGNTTYDIQAKNYFNGVHTVVDASNNWWGTTNAGAIGNRIYDYSDDATGPVVHFTPFLQSPGGAPVTGSTYLDGALSTTTPLAAGIYEVVGDLYVDAGSTLTIQAGTTLNFNNSYAIFAEGSIQVQGTAGSPVTFTSPTNVAGSWSGLILYGTGSVINHAVVAYADNGITVDGTNATITNSVIRNCNHGIQMENGAGGTVSGNQITANDVGVFLTGDGLVGHNPLPVVTNNDLAGNTTFNFQTQAYHSPASAIINATNNWWGSTDATTISAKIYDHTDNGNAAKVNFTPFLASSGSAPVGTPILPDDLEFGPTAGMLTSVNITNGLVVQSRKDFSFATPNGFGLGLTAVYNSRLARQGAMGYGWTHSFEASLQPTVVVNSQTYLKITDSAGQGHYFQDAGGGNYQGAFFEHTSVRFTTGVYTWTLLNGASLKFNSSGKLTGTSDAVGNTLTLGYDGTSRLSTVTDSASGRSFTLNYNGANQVQSVTGPITTAVSDGIWVTYGYANNNLTSVTYADGSGYTYVYNDASGDVHNLTAQQDKMGHTKQTWTYDTQDRVTQAWNANNGGINLITYTNDSTVTVTDAYNVSRTYSITNLFGHKRLTAMTGPVPMPYDGNTMVRWEYDTSLNLYEVEDGGGTVHRYENFDSRGNPGVVRLAFNTTEERVITATYHPWINAVLTKSEASVLGAGNRETIYDYDNDGNTTPNENPTAQVSRGINQGFTRNAAGAVIPYQYITKYAYNAKGQTTSVDGPLPGVADTTSYNYDPTTGNLLSQARPIVGATTYSSYDAAGRARVVTDVNNHGIEYTYDGHGRTTQTKNLIDNTTSNTLYNLGGKVQSTTDADGVITTYTYRASDGLADRVIDAKGNYIKYDYDAQGNNIKVGKYTAANVLTKENTWTYQHPTIPGQLWKSSQADGTFTEYEYDGAGNQASVTDPKQHTTSYTYDALHRRKTTSQPGAATTSYNYDAHGNLTLLTDAESKSTAYVFDDAGRMLSLTSPDTGASTYVYDVDANTMRKTDAMGITTTTAYDTLNRVTSISYPDAAENVAYTYDTATNGKGRLARTTDQAGETVYQYDSRERQFEKTVTISGVGYTLSRSFTNAGRLVSLTYPAGMVVTNNYDPVSMQVSGVTATYNEQTKTLTSNMVYKPFGGVTGLSTGTGANIANEDSPCGCTVQKTNPGSDMEMVYNHDSNRNLTGITFTNHAGRNQTFDYDDRNRLTNATGVFGSATYTYDKVGNRRTQTITQNSVTLVNETYTYTHGTDRLAQITGTNPVAYEYDANGNPITLGNRTLTYNQNNRLVEVKALTTTLGKYTYNSQGKRVKKQTSLGTTVFLYDFDGNLIAEATESGALQRAYINFGTAPYALLEVPTNNLYFYGNDNLGTPQIMTNEANQSVWEAYYKPYGDAHVNVYSKVKNNIRFPGQYYDEETGWHYNGWRYYDPNAGRYLTPDPIGLRGGINLFGYVQDNPVNRIDPLGLLTWDEFRDWSITVAMATLPDALSPLAPSLTPEAWIQLQINFYNKTDSLKNEGNNQIYFDPNNPLKSYEELLKAHQQMQKPCD